MVTLHRFDDIVSALDLIGRPHVNKQRVARDDLEGRVDEELHRRIEYFELHEALIDFVRAELGRGLFDRLPSIDGNNWITKELKYDCSLS